jgi:hypothetical protein
MGWQMESIFRLDHSPAPHEPLAHLPMNMETYTINDIIATKVPSTAKWVKSSQAEE